MKDIAAKSARLPIVMIEGRGGRDQKKSDDDKWRRILSQTLSNQIRAKAKATPKSARPTKCATVKRTNREIPEQESKSGA